MGLVGQGYIGGWVRNLQGTEQILDSYKRYVECRTEAASDDGGPKGRGICILLLFYFYCDFIICAIAFTL